MKLNEIAVVKQLISIYVVFWKPIQMTFVDFEMLMTSLYIRFKTGMHPLDNMKM